MSKNSDVIELKTINKTEVAAAETELTFTDRSSGDNYQIRAGFNKRCESVGSSIPFVAWKRIYIELDNMYKKGATITLAFAPDGDATDDVLSVDNTDDFVVGTKITIFTNVGLTVDREIKTINYTTKAITVADLKDAIPLYSGIKIQTDNSIYTINETLRGDAFGLITDGMDGGAFVEFAHTPSGSGNVPKYKRFPDDDVVNYNLHWFQSTNKKNLLQLIASSQKVTGK